MKISAARNCIIAKSKKEVELAKTCDLCRYIILESGNVIYIWSRKNRSWYKEKYIAFGKDEEKDEETTGIKAYQAFYAYCGKDNVERMKNIYTPIPMWESYEQMHYANIEFIGEKMYKTIYEFDANSAFTYGVTRLPDGFEPLKEYMLLLYDKKKSATNSINRKTYKNLQNYLIGYFARVKNFVRVRSEIIHESNLNIQFKMSEIIKNGGNVYLSNTDSIVTDEKGADVMFKYVGDDVGLFKISKKVDRLCYKSPNVYQLGDKVVYSGVGYFARQNVDLFNDIEAVQKGTLIEPFDFDIEYSEEDYKKICRVRYGEIKVTVTNLIGEKIDEIIYKLR